MSDNDAKAIPIDEEQLRDLAVADLLNVEGPVVFRESNSVYLRLHIRRGHGRDEYPVLGADLDDLAQIAEKMRRALENEA